jgi:hypothetical protein
MIFLPLPEPDATGGTTTRHACLVSTGRTRDLLYVKLAKVSYTSTAHLANGPAVRPTPERRAASSHNRLGSHGEELVPHAAIRPSSRPSPHPLACRVARFHCALFVSTNSNAKSPFRKAHISSSILRPKTLLCTAVTGYSPLLLFQLASNTL